MLTPEQKQAIPAVLRLAKRQLHFDRSLAMHTELGLDVDCMHYERAIDQVHALLDQPTLEVTEELVTLASSTFYNNGVLGTVKREEMRAALTAVFERLKGKA